MVLQLVQTSVQADLSLNLYDPTEPMVLKVSMATQPALWKLSPNKKSTSRV